jgi:hypothetical protein
MREIASFLIVLALLCASAALGAFVRRRLPEHHRTRETTELMQLTIGLLMTFAAIVLGLLTASVKQSYDDATLDRQQYALELGALDACLRDYGPEADAARADLHSYTAAVIASTWPGEPPPKGVSYPDTSHMPRTGASPVLGRLMDKVGVEVSRLDSAPHPRLAALCLDRYKDVSHGRLSVIEAANDQRVDPFYQVLVLWLMIIFACYGLVAPPTRLSLTVVVLCAISLSSVMFVIVDLGRPYGGFFSIPSTAMRDALHAMLGHTP